MQCEVTARLVEIGCKASASCEELVMGKAAVAEAGGYALELEVGVAHTPEQVDRARWARANGGRERGQRAGLGLGVDIVCCEAWTMASQSRGQTPVEALAAAGDTGDHASIALSAAKYSAEEAAGGASSVSARHEQAHLDKRGFVWCEERFPGSGDRLGPCVIAPSLVEPVAVENAPNGCRVPSVGAGRRHALGGEGSGDDGGGQADEVVVDHPADERGFDRVEGAVAAVSVVASTV